MPGFGLLEIVIALAIIGILASLVGPAFFKRAPAQERKVFIAALNTIIAETWTRALLNRRIQKIIIDPEKHEIRFEQFVNEPTKADATQEALETVKSEIFGSLYVYPKHIDIHNVFVEGIDEMTRHGTDSAVHGVWFFIIPDGNAQEVIINYTDTKDVNFSIDGKNGSLKLNPFMVIFDEFDAYVYPS